MLLSVNRIGLEKYLPDQVQTESILGTHSCLQEKLLQIPHDKEEILVLGG
jgi:hypothetical protein